MKYKIHPLWWPLLILSSPILLPYLYYKNESYSLCTDNIDKINKQRIQQTNELELLELKNINLTAVVDAKAEANFVSEAGISYLLETARSNILFDVAFADQSSTFNNNFKKLKLDQKNISELVISHLHPDHMGGIKASRKNSINIPEIINHDSLSVHLPDAAEVKGSEKNITYAPELITDFIATTGPLRANLFFSGPTEEQSLVIKLKNKGLVVIIGCGHPDLEKILKMAEKIGGEKVYAVIGGLHLPVKIGRLQQAGIDFQRIIGTGQKPWKRLDDNYLDQKISTLEEFEVEKILLSPHDSSDYAADYFKNNLQAEVEIIKSGSSYHF